MSSIDTVTRKNGEKRYVVRYRTPEGAGRKKAFKKKADAEAFRATTEHKKATGEFVDPAAGRITFAEYAEAWLEYRRVTVSHSTAETYASQLRRHLIPEFGTTQLRAITSERVKMFAARLGQGDHAPTTVRQIAYLLASVLREAVRDGRIAKNPAEGIKSGKQDGPPRRPDAHVERRGQGPDGRGRDASALARRSRTDGGHRAAARRVPRANR